MQLPSDVGRMLGTVYATAVRGTEADTRASALRGIGDRYAVYGPGDHSILFQGDALRTAEGMVDALTGSALTDGGFAPDSLRRHIADACRAATVDDAIARLTQLLAEEPVEYTFGEPILAHFNGEGPAQLGRCLVHQNLTGLVATVPQFLAEDFPARLVTATVNARDEWSAYLRAVNAIDEAKSILQLANQQSGGRKRMPTVMTSVTSKLGTWSVGGEGFFTAASAPNEVLTWPYHDLAAAARTPVDRRTELEQRALGATRWHYEATSTVWPTGALTAAMSALETLLLPPGIKKGKGNKLAVILRDLGGTPWAPAGTKFTTWFVNLYNRRNDATHQGISYNEDANVRRLLGLTHASIHLGVHPPLSIARQHA